MLSRTHGHSLAVCRCGRAMPDEVCYACGTALVQLAEPREPEPRQPPVCSCGRAMEPRGPGYHCECGSRFLPPLSKAPEPGPTLRLVT